MSEQITVGSIVEGKVTRITDFGAIVSIGNGKQGLVHISQIANTFVQNINDHVKVNDTVKVKVLSIDNEKNRISLSMRAAMPKPEHEHHEHYEHHSSGQKQSGQFKGHNNKNTAPPSQNQKLDDFEEKMKEFLKQSNEKMAGLNKRANKRQ
ncbi:MAG: S1 RNA-binding domain-containing protein [Clostridia bacterium]|jgi:general stress protein 13/S1 RNA binding domain protein|nr:S1 RNA-binding domain-containing protein [Clostridia bacterium]MCI1999129.1 S1 RNA-binding domain-containing protein [Clostridia bacterium]MCI2013879.1 S1 RNA-binding domain-containing protein [Clostridia bacterium]